MWKKDEDVEERENECSLKFHGRGLRREKMEGVRMRKLVNCVVEMEEWQCCE